MRLIRGLAALAALLVGLFGIPAALVVLGGNPFPSDLTPSAAVSALMRPDDGGILISLVTIIGWLAWLIFAISAVAETVSLASGYRIHIRVPGLGGTQRLTALLLVAVVAMIVVPQGASAHPTPGPTPTTPSLTTPSTHAGEERDRDREKPSRSAKTSAHPDRVNQVRDQPTAGETAGRTYVVRSGDDLWSLAERFYGQGQEWRTIARANPGVLSGGPDRLEVGWRLIIPPAIATTGPTHAGARESANEPRHVTVDRGDTLSSIAQAEYGDPSRWPVIFEANRAQLSDPDELAIGMQLTVPTSAQQQARRAPPPAESETRDSKRSAPAPTPPHPDAGTQDQGRADEASPGRGPDAPAPAPTPPSPTRPGRVPGDTATAASDGTATPTPHSTATPASGGTATTVPAGAGQAPADQHAPDQTDPADLGLVEITVGLSSVGALLAAGVITGLAARRRMQLQTRPVGRRIQPASPQAAVAETTLGRRQQPLTLRTLDLALRAISAHCLDQEMQLPRLVSAQVSDTRIELVMESPMAQPPVGFDVVDRTWTLVAEDADYLKTVPGIGEAPRPYPALVTLGHDDAGAALLIDLESTGVVSLSGNASSTEAILAALAVDLSFSTWADEMSLSLVGACPGLPSALGKHNVEATSDLDALLDQLEERARVQQSHGGLPVRDRHRIDPDLADAWAPHVVLVNSELTPTQRDRLLAVAAPPGVTIGAVVLGNVEAPWVLSVTSGTDDAQPDSAELKPIGLRFRPQLIEQTAVAAMVDLIDATGSAETTPAPWWGPSRVSTDPPNPPDDQGARIGRRFAGWVEEERATEGWSEMREQAGVTALAEGAAPLLQLLGPIGLVGASGTVPPRARKQCLEYCAWLLEHPRTTARAMSAALAVAEGTRRSNMSRLRTWLGVNPDGEPYLPDAYTGRISLHPSVSSDWQQLQMLTMGGVNRASSDRLRSALELVRGAPLADAAPGQWHWAEELRTDMVSVIRDIGVELSSRALANRDLDLARWSAARSLIAAPGDELLMAARIRTEHQAGNTQETHRLGRQVAAHARSLGLDLEPETVDLLQQVIEGQVRSRLA